MLCEQDASAAPRAWLLCQAGRFFRPLKRNNAIGNEFAALPRPKLFTPGGHLCRIAWNLIGSPYVIVTSGMSNVWLCWVAMTSALPAAVEVFRRRASAGQDRYTTCHGKKLHAEELYRPFVSMALRHPFVVIGMAVLGVVLSLLLSTTRLEFHTPAT
jgi:hypothetical protein